MEKKFLKIIILTCNLLFSSIVFSKKIDLVCYWKLLKVKVPQSRKVFWLWFHCQQKLPNHSPKQKIWISCRVPKLFTFIGRKFKFSVMESDLALFVGNGTKVKIPSKIKPPLLPILILVKIVDVIYGQPTLH